jgi:hypothetical protein
MPPPAQLLAAFHAAAQASHVGVVLVEDGFDADAMRVLAAFQNATQRWSAPARPCPDGGLPTAAAWAWLMSGWQIDELALADAAGLSVATTRAKLAMLTGARLIFPDGSMNKWALAALNAHVAARIGPSSGKRKKKAPPEDAN